MSDPDLSTLPKRMRYAADVMDEYISATSLHSGNPFAAHNLRVAADRLETRREAKVEELARELCAGFHHASELPNNPVLADYYRRVAGELIESGWRKEDPR